MNIYEKIEWVLKELPLVKAKGKYNLKELRRLRELYSYDKLMAVVESAKNEDTFVVVIDSCTTCKVEYEYEVILIDLGDYILYPNGKCQDCAKKELILEEQDQEHFESSFKEFEKFGSTLQMLLRLDSRSEYYAADEDEFKTLTNLHRLCEIGIISRRIKEMPYSLFLKTSYWRTISAEVKRRAKYKCNRCSKKEGLQVHHTEYSFHGFEVVNLHKLECLCYECHEKHHNK